MDWLKGLSWAWRAVLAAAVLALIAFAGWWTFVRPAHLHQETVQAKAGQVVAETQTQATRQAMDIVVHTQETKRVIDARVVEQSRAILSAPGANENLSPDLVARGRIALCLQHNRADDPVCAIMFHGADDGNGTDAADPPRLDPSGLDSGRMG